MFISQGTKKTALYVKGHDMCNDKKENDNIGYIGQDLQENAIPLKKRTEFNVAHNGELMQYLNSLLHVSEKS